MSGFGDEPHEHTCHSLHALRDELPRLEAICDTYEQRAQAIPHRTHAITLELSLARRLLQAHRDWIDDIDRELAARGENPSDDEPA